MFLHGQTCKIAEIPKLEVGASLAKVHKLHHKSFKQFNIYQASSSYSFSEIIWQDLICSPCFPVCLMQADFLEMKHKSKLIMITSANSIAKQQTNNLYKQD